MKNKLATIFVLGAMALLSCCSSVKTASLGAGATAGKDYVTNLRPSAAARQYFDKIGNKAPMETLTRANAARSKSGVRFVADDGILIPPGVTISFSNKGYCLDPKLPAPVADEEYQLVPTSALIPSKLQGIYQNLLRRAAAGDSTVKSNMQGLVWALRTAGVEGGYASRISDNQRRILDSCSTRPGEFERIHKSGLTTNKLVGELWKLADSAVHVDIAGRRWKPSDFSSAGSFNSAINSQLNSLISQGSKLPIQRTGFNYGELEPGIYTDVRGIGNLAFHAKIANTTNKDFIFYPSNYVGQVGSGSALSSSYTQRQRVSMGPVDLLNVLDKREPQKKEQRDLKPQSFDSLSSKEQKELLEMARLGQYSYLDNEKLKKQLIADGYTIVTENLNNDGGLTYAILKKGDTNYITFRGSKKITDFIDDSQILFSKDINFVGQFIVAKQIVQKYMNEHPGEKIILVGHSLAGATVQSVLSLISSSDLRGYTFNSYGLPGNQGKKVDDRITDIYYQYDIVHTLLNDSRLFGKKQIVVNRFSSKVDVLAIAKEGGHEGVGTLIPFYNTLREHSMDTLAKKMKEQAK